MAFPNPHRHESARPGLASDYPSTLDGLFALEVSYPTIAPPNYPIALHPDVYQQEQARVRKRFESAVELAEQAFATELQRLTAHPAERLTELHDGQPKVFRDSAVETSWSSSSGSGGSTSGAAPNWMPS